MRLLQSLTRGLRTLDLLHASDQPMRLTEIADELSVDKSNASHVLKTLVASGYAAQDGSRRYVASDRHNGGGHEHSLSDVVACKERCRPALEALVRETGECAHLAVLVDTRVWYIDKVDSILPLKVDHPIGSLSPLHCTALGKAFLSFGNATLPADRPRYTPKTITDEDALLAELAQTRSRGFAIDDEEFAPGIRCAARPVFDVRDRMIAALGVSGPSVRVDDDRLKELGELVRATPLTPFREPR
ncbi:Acetate operon repressor (plasmid) [Labrenzia sp. THAF191b]|uniref:IclR family transcriptional regulator n=1 Tax=unclassified Labrenzia TaxID=2648686 RepID=UPI0004B2B97A|nr:MULTISPECIES: IclR family transcriptional regulator [unclassified Labrenzia]QFT01660.1 Acetate operon repressor [Labrenzia sp. THAF191b]QFT07865.1 Acetate operon repressor [Labrenzia sp. THAF191a]QFT19269.1 Acetate operon repressor [Labrenzia sp. THAF187b]